MNDQEKAAAPEAQAQEAVAEESLLERAIGATKQTERSQAEELLRALTEEALKGTVTWDRNLGKTINKAIAAIDQALSGQLAAIMHAPDDGLLVDR